MATRAEINEKYGVTRLMSPHVANEELSKEEAETYERQIKFISNNFDKFLAEDDAGDID